MAIRLGCVSILCVGCLIVPMAQANKIQNNASVSAHVSVGATGSNHAGFGAIDEDLRHIVEQVMYGKTPGQVIDELVSTYGYGEQSTTSLAAIAGLLSEQLGYLSFAIESAQAIIAVLPPTSPHIVVAKLVINEMSIFATCAQTVLTQIQQNAQATTPAVAPAAPAASVSPNIGAASSSNHALASEAIALFSDIASAVAASSASVSNSNTHHHGSHTSSR